VEAAGAEQVIQDSVEGFAVGAVDAGIALGNLMTAARAAGLGVVPIGGIRRNPQAMIELLQLPEHLPHCWRGLGYVDQDSSIKPRLPRESFVHHEHYQAAQLPEQIRQYDQTLASYWQQIGRPDGLPWTPTPRSTTRMCISPKLPPSPASRALVLIVDQLVFAHRKN
jgi:FMN reductase [NAD(P)H]